MRLTVGRPVAWPACCRVVAVWLLMAMPFVQVIAAGMDTDSSRLEASDFEKTPPGTRFTSPSGSTELDNGMIMKWGEETIPALTTSAAVTFSTAFPTNLLSVQISVVGAALSGASATVSGTSSTGFTINLQCLALTGPVACSAANTVKWSAYGY